MPFKLHLHRRQLLIQGYTECTIGSLKRKSLLKSRAEDGEINNRRCRRGRRDNEWKTENGLPSQPGEKYFADYSELKKHTLNQKLTPRIGLLRNRRSAALNDCGARQAIAASSPRREVVTVAPRYIQHQSRQKHESRWASSSHLAWLSALSTAANITDNAIAEAAMVVS